MAGEITVSYVPSQSPITTDVFTAAGVERIADISLPETPADSGHYVGDFAAITPGDEILAFHNGVYIGGEVYEQNVAVSTTVATIVTADTVITLTDGSAANDFYNNMIISIQDISGQVTVARRILGYVGASKQVTMDFDTEFAIQAGDRVRIWANAYDSAGGPSAAQISASVWKATNSDFNDPNTMGRKQNQTGGGLRTG
ncbi:MAG TPA: hypothetical protein ENI05_06070 [Porticoccus sp.]|nr:hypothetical protein [Porticoccus sp.]